VGDEEYDENEDDEAPLEPTIPDITIPPEWVPGAYANATVVAYNAFEFTIDFVRLDPWNNTGVVVARISCPHEVANQFAITLTQQLQSWANGLLSESGGKGNGETHYRPDDPGADPSP
jgi:hypothetical protein